MRMHSALTTAFVLVATFSLVGCSRYYVRTDEAPPAAPIPYKEEQVQRDKIKCATPREWYSRTSTDVFGRAKEELVCGTLAGINLFDFGNWLFYRPFGDVHEAKPIPFYKKVVFTSVLCEGPAGWRLQKYVGLRGNVDQDLVCATPETYEIRPVGPPWGYFGFGGAPFMPMMGGFGGTQYWPR